jgi:hypothetical protein
MRAARLWTLLPLFLLVGGSTVLEPRARTAAPTARTTEKPAKAPVAFEARMEDKSLVRIQLLQEQIVVSTLYGRLTVPARDVRQIDFGHHPPAGTEKRIREAIGRLGDKTFAVREKAGKELLSLGTLSCAALREAAKGGDIEIVRRVRELLKKLEARYPEAERNRKWHDVVHTPTFTIVGRIEGSTLKVKTAYFGEAELKLADLWTVRSLEKGSEITVAVDAAKYAAPGIGVAEWLETDVEVTSGSTLQITATGEIDMYPLGADTGMYMAGPGGAKWGRQWGVMAAQQPGMLIGRIGAKGREFIIGERYNERATEEGRLFMRIVPSPWNNASTGEYKVTISVR